MTHMTPEEQTRVNAACDRLEAAEKALRLGSTDRFPCDVAGCRGWSIWPGGFCAKHQAAEDAATYEDRREARRMARD